MNKVDTQVCLKRFTELSTLELYEILRLRSNVFVVEQNCVYQDMDNKDLHSECWHLLLLVGNTLVGYARLLPPGVSYKQASIGRVLIAESFRRKGLAEYLMTVSVEKCLKVFGTSSIQIGAQCYLEKFYSKLGFQPNSKPYDEDGIMHLDMLYHSK